MGDIAPFNLPMPAHELKSQLSEFFPFDTHVFANLETPITLFDKPALNKKYSFRSEPDVLSAIPDNFVFSLANNHILDYGFEGLSDTMKYLEIKGIPYTGAGKNIDEAGKPLILKYYDKVIGFIASADKRYGSASINSPGIFPATPELLIPRISDLKRKSDIVILSIHMGMEYMPLPTPVMRKLAADCHESGADFIFFHHSHCISGYSCTDKKTTLWGTGNFIFPGYQHTGFKPWFDSACWQCTYYFETNNYDLDIQTFKLRLDGIPIKTTDQQAAQIIWSIESMKKIIGKSKCIELYLLKYALRLSYLKIIFINYTDMIKRTGIQKTLYQVYLSVIELFLKKN